MPASAVKLISPYGGDLVDLLVSPGDAEQLKATSATIGSITLSDRQVCDLEMLATGAFSPLTTFMSQADYQSVLRSMRLADGTVFPIPITLALDKQYQRGDKLALRDRYGNLLAVMEITESYSWERREFASSVFGSTDEAHNLIRELRSWGPFNASGKLQVIALPAHKDFIRLRRSPAEVRRCLIALGNPDVVAFQTRNPLHRAHEEMTKRAASNIGGTLLLHPVVGLTKPGDVDHITRVRAYKVLIDNYYQEIPALLSLMPLAMRMAGPREALWHAIIRRNYGANHFIVGRDHAGPDKDSQGRSFFGPYDAQELAKKYAPDIGMKILTFSEMTYVPAEDRYEEVSALSDSAITSSISGTQVRRDYLASGRPLPAWFTRPEIARILEDAYVPTLRQGFCLWFTGLSGSGKSTIAQAVEAHIQEQGRRTTMLDGDVVRQNLSKGLGFSPEDRDTNIQRVGFVASKIVYHHGVVLCALISPFEQSRRRVAALFDPANFIEVYVATPLEVCQERDPKGHYEKTRQGKLKNFTGVSAAYETPIDPAVTIDTSDLSVDQCAEQVLTELRSRGFLI